MSDAVAGGATPGNLVSPSLIAPLAVAATATVVFPALAVRRFSRQDI